MIYARPFFDLQCEFARAAARLQPCSIEQALLDYTNFYARFGLGRDFDAANPVWQRFIEDIGRSNDGDLESRTYRFYESRLPEREPPRVVSRVGCFSYARLGADRLRLHFIDGDGGGSPLAGDRQERRHDELRTLFALAVAQESGASTVVGSSWLYNLPAYRRLFPQAYLVTAAVVANAFRTMPLWGQFVDRHGHLRPGVQTWFRQRLDEVTGIDALPSCFPLAVLRLELPLGMLCRHYAN